MLRWFIILATFFLTHKVLGQTVQLTGTISANSEKLPSASIQLKTFGDEELLFYGFSDDEGNYNIGGKIDGSAKFLLIAAYIGYKKDTLIINRADLVKQAIFKHNFSLIEDKTQLDEIYIKAPNPVQVTNDTTSYNVQRFTSPEDRNLESVIKKMPGMEVNKDGTIFFKGKKISKVLLEGDDLTGEGYKAITKNLKPEFVEAVQALEHYVEDNLLKGIINSDDIVLNLKIKNKQAKKVIGSIDGGLGTNNRRIISTNLISFIDKTKVFAFANHNNLSTESNQNPLELVDENRAFTGSNQLIRHQVGTYNPFDATSYTLNNAIHGSANAITRLTDRFKIGYGVIYLWNKLYGQTTMRSTYFGPNAIYTEDNDNRKSLNKTFKADFSVDYLVKNNARFWAKFSYKQVPERFNSIAYSVYNNLIGDSVLQNQADLNRNFNAQLKYTVKVNRTTAYLISARVLTDDVGQKYETGSALYQSIPMFNGTQNLLQTVNNNNFKLKLDFEGLKRSNTSFLYLNIGNEANDFTIKSDLLGRYQDNQIPIGNAYINDNVFKQNQTYVIGKYVYDNQPIKIQAQLKSSLLFLKNMGKDSTYMILEPSLSFSYKLSDIQQLSVGYNYKNINPQPIEYYGHYILTDLRNFNSGLTNFYNYNTHVLNINYNLNDFANSYFNLNIAINGSYSKYGFLYTNFFDNTLNYSRKEPFRGIKTMSSNFSAKKFFPLFSLSITANYTPSYSAYYGKVVDVVNEYHAFNQNALLKINTGFNLPINFGLGAELQFNSTRSKERQVAENKSYRYTIEYRYKISDQIFNFSSYNMYKMNGQNFNLIDTELQYNPAKGSFKYSIQGKNLANLKAFTNFNISEVSSSNYSSSILGRYIMLNVSMSIK
ncbi:hypothetical protein [Pedobacter miscanthi]|uniref:TonB-dependent receptor n=1 Tax=Pedobacter miscanthi TaxID=2259170 RepID=A0A366KQ79_9SPHI|nr:hypothetical protein [Pedobacter miscanthi]RBQ03795.1 hypothetical protein DRW42_20075 [Pedobacter miscanthi]